MTREEAIGKWIYPAIATMWNKNKCNEILEAIEQDPCEDAISRKALLSKAWFVTGDDFPIEGLEYITKGMVENMPSVIPQPKTGHWIYKNGIRYCEFCGASNSTAYASYCPNCGAKMVEPQESEDKDE